MLLDAESPVKHEICDLVSKVTHEWVFESHFFDQLIVNKNLPYKFRVSLPSMRTSYQIKGQYLSTQLEAIVNKVDNNTDKRDTIWRSPSIKGNSTTRLVLLQFSSQSVSGIACQGM